MKNLGDAISRLVKHTAYTMASIASVTISIACVASIVVLLEREAIYLPAFGAGATTREHRDDEEMIRRIAKEQQSLRRTAASLLHLRSDEELRTSIAVEMEFNDKEYKQSFSGGRAATRVIEQLQGNLNFVYAHVHSTGLEKSKCHGSILPGVK